MAGLEGAGHHGLQAMLQGTGLVYNKAGLGAEATQGMFHHSLYVCPFFCFINLVGE